MKTVRNSIKAVIIRDGAGIPGGCGVVRRRKMMKRQVKKIIENKQKEVLETFYNSCREQASKKLNELITRNIARSSYCINEIDEIYIQRMKTCIDDQLAFIKGIPASLNIKYKRNDFDYIKNLLIHQLALINNFCIEGRSRIISKVGLKEQDVRNQDLENNYALYLAKIDREIDTIYLEQRVKRDPALWVSIINLLTQFLGWFAQK